VLPRPPSPSQLAGRAPTPRPGPPSAPPKTDRTWDVLIYHPWDVAIRGHVFVSFLGVVLHDELERRVAAKGLRPEGGQVRQALAVA
jgi:hypothetical protein